MEANLQLNQSHVTDEQLSELLLGTSSADVLQHLEACEQCSREAGEFSAAVLAFEQQSWLWAERRSATAPFMAPQRQAGFFWLHQPYSWAGAVLALIVAFALGISLERSHIQPVDAPVAAMQPAPKASSTVLQADNQLLGAIDGELRSDDSASVRLYGLNADARSRHRSARKAVD